MRRDLCAKCHARPRDGKHAACSTCRKYLRAQRKRLDALAQGRGGTPPEGSSMRGEAPPIIAEQSAAPLDTYAPPNETRRRNKSRRFLTALMHTSGLTNKQISARLQVSEASVSKWLGEEEVRGYVQDLRAEQARAYTDVQEFLDLQAMPSAAKLVQLRDEPKNSPMEEVSRKAANDLLDRSTRYARRSKTEASPVVHIHLDERAIAQMKAAWPGPSGGVLEAHPEPPE